jgi:hypothetical protein
LKRLFSDRNIWLVVFAVLLLRLPFLDQAMQGDDIIYLSAAQHAQVEPLHPNRFEYVFMGKKVDMRGHPHPPFNAWYLGALLAVFGDIKEPVFHAAYIPFSLIAALSMLSIARRFTDKPLVATFLFLAVPPFVVNGNSLESDIPFLAFWLLAIAAYLSERMWLSMLAGALAALCAFQAIVMVPLLFLAPVTRRMWPAVLAPALAIAGFQGFERLTSDTLPAAVLSGYLSRFGWQEVAVKLRNAAALTGHLAVTLVFPLVWIQRRTEAIRQQRFLYVWIALFFAFALAIFFVGSARYLLPLAAPLCILASAGRFAIPAAIVQGTLAVAMAVVNFQHWGGLRDFAMSVPIGDARRVFVADEWGLRFYMESRGAIPLEVGQKFRSGDILVSSAYVETPPGNRTLLKQAEIQSPIPVRIVGLGARTAYSSMQFGLLPYEFSLVPLDRPRAEKVVEFTPTLEYVQIGASEEANRHIVSGISPSDRWTLQQAALALKRPAVEKARIAVKFYVPQNGVGRTAEFALDGKPLRTVTIDHDGIYELDWEVDVPGGTASVLTIQVDKPLQAPGDQRLLGVNLLEAGFRPVTP